MFNPMLGRWMEEDPIGFDAGDTNLYRFVGNNPTTATDPTGLKPPKVTNDHIPESGYPKYGFNGQFIWGVRFKLSAPAGKKGGYILQHVRVSYNVRNTDGEKRTIKQLIGTADYDKRKSFFSDDFTEDYWEVWRVEPGKVYPVESSKLSSASLAFLRSLGVNPTSWPSNDFYAKGPYAGTSGRLIMTGEVYFLDDFSEDDIKALGFKRYDGADETSPAGNLLSVPSKGGVEKIRDRIKGLDPEDVLPHSIAVEWRLGGKTQQTGVLCPPVRLGDIKITIPK